MGKTKSFFFRKNCWPLSCPKLETDRRHILSSTRGVLTCLAYATVTKVNINQMRPISLGRKTILIYREGRNLHLSRRKEGKSVSDKKNFEYNLKSINFRSAPFLRNIFVKSQTQMTTRVGFEWN
jgi:hypothetical protein